MTKAKKNTPTLSLIIPAYNETTRLVSGLYHALTYLSAKRYTWEIIVVDDGSKIPVTVVIGAARTVKLLQLHRHFPLTVYRLEKNYGKGRAIAEGVKRANGRYIVFCDADLSVPISTVDEILAHLPRFPVVITSRRTQGSKIITHQTPMREAAGRIFTKLSNVLCATHVVDATCGCKGFTSDTAKRLFGASRIHRWVFDTEILFLARKYGIDIFELPVRWTNKEGSKVRGTDVLRSLYDLLLIRWYDMRGEYDK
jgi:dolichyl-phosphate beta-glucosyltransferase